MSAAISPAVSGRNPLPGKKRDIGSIPRLVYAVCGGNLLYLMLLLNFGIYEFSLGHYAYRIAPNPEKIPLAVMMVSVLATVLALAVPSHRSLVGLFSHLCFVMLFVPLCAVYTLLDGATAFVLSCGAALALCFLLFGQRGGIVIDKKSSFDRPVALLFGAISIFALASLATQGNLSFTFVPFREVYDLRSEAQSGIDISAGRIVTISAYTAASYLLMYGILYRNIFYLSFGGITSYTLYCTFGFKLFLFFPFISICLYMYHITRNSYIFLYIIIFVFFFIKLSQGIDSLYLDSLLTFLNETIIRRYFYVPGFLAFAWYETFLEEPFVHMSNIFMLNRILEYPFDVIYSTVVALRIFGSEFNPNASFMAYGFANFGYFGIFLFSIVTFGLLSIVDRISARLKSAYLALGAAAPAFLFLEADPLVVVISFGFGIILLVGIAGYLTAGRRRGRGVFSGPRAPRAGNPAPLAIRPQSSQD